MLSLIAKGTNYGNSPGFMGLNNLYIYVYVLHLKVLKNNIYISHGQTDTKPYKKYKIISQLLVVHSFVL